MRILFLAADLPWPADQGDRIRAYNILKRLGSRHEVTLVAFKREGAVCDPGPLHDFCRDIRLVPITRGELYLGAFRHPLLPSAVGGHLQPRMTEEIRRILTSGNIDVVYVYQLKMAAHLMGLQGLSGGASTEAPAEHEGTFINAVPMALDLTDALSTFVRRSWPMRTGAFSKAYGLVEYLRLKRWEARAAQAFDLTWLVSEPDRKAIQALAPKANLRVLPNGVDTREFSPQFSPGCGTDPVDRVPALGGGRLSAACGHVSPQTEEADAGPEMVFHGNMGYAPNVDGILYFFRNIFPSIKAQVPSVRLTIVGKTPPQEVSALAREPEVSVTGLVPDIRPYLARASIIIAPIRYAAGTRVKILEAMAMAKPVVSTTIGAEGLEVTHGEDILLADSPDAFATALVSLLENPDRCQVIGRRARVLAEARYSWDFIAGRAEQDLLKLIRKW